MNTLGIICLEHVQGRDQCRDPALQFLSVKEDVCGGLTLSYRVNCGLPTGYLSSAKVNFNF